VKHLDEELEKKLQNNLALVRLITCKRELKLTDKLAVQSHPTEKRPGVACKQLGNAEHTQSDAR
jgi:hypothetical protein